MHVLKQEAIVVEFKKSDFAVAAAAPQVHSSPCYSESPPPTDRRQPVSERAMVVRGERRRRRSPSEGRYKPKGRPQRYVDAEGRDCSTEES